MERSPFPKGFTDEQQKWINDNIFDQASGVPIILKAAPTTVGKELSEGKRGFFGGFVYETINNVTYRYTVVQV